MYSKSKKYPYNASKKEACCTECAAKLGEKNTLAFWICSRGFVLICTVTTDDCLSISLQLELLPQQIVIYNQTY